MLHTPLLFVDSENGGARKVLTWLVRQAVPGSQGNDALCFIYFSAVNLTIGLSSQLCVSLNTPCSAPACCFWSSVLVAFRRANGGFSLIDNL